MKKINSLLIVLCSLLIFTSCEEKAQKKSIEVASTEKNEISADANLKKIALNIEGMTCEIGCARTIQSKLSKTQGVKFAKVNFDEKKGIVEYDANKISEKQIKAVVEDIAGGDVYKVADIKPTE